MLTARLSIWLLQDAAARSAEGTPAQVREWRARIKQVLSYPDPSRPQAAVSVSAASNQHQASSIAKSGKSKLMPITTSSGATNPVTGIVCKYQ